jgi:thioredoxin-related protein
MKLLFVLLMIGFGHPFAEWQPDFETAKKLATENHKYILVNFSGSDWCGPCIRLKKEVFDSDVFGKLADGSLVLYNADFPRSKKNQLSKETVHRNEELANKYNPLGKFPYTLLLTPEGKVIQSWEGYPQNNSRLFIDQIKSVCNADHH